MKPRKPRDRRDARIKSGSVIAGLRLEKEAAQRLCEAAIKNAEETAPKPLQPPLPRGDVTGMVRYFIRTGLGVSHDDANRREFEARVHASGVAGLSLETDMIVQLQRVATAHGMSKVGYVRHLVRLGLDFRPEVSLQLEKRFARIAEARHALAEAYKEM